MHTDHTVMDVEELSQTPCYSMHTDHTVMEVED